MTITPSGGSTDVDEGNVAATDSFTIQLDSQPSAQVTVTASNADGQVKVSTDNATWQSSANFFINDLSLQTVYVQAVDDAIAEGSPHTGTVSFALSSSDGNYNGLSVSNVTVNVYDNDSAAVIVDELNGLSVTEGGATDTYTIVLTSQPTASVTVNVTPDSQVSVDKPSVSFNNGDWNIPQAVTVTAVDDAIVEPSPHTGTITHSTSSTDPNYNGLPVADATADITDNDVAPPPLGLSAHHSPEPVKVGQRVVEILDLTANGASFTGVHITNTAPSSMTFAALSTTQGTCTAPSPGSSGPVDCDLGSLADGATATVQIWLRTTRTGSLQDTASRSSIETGTLPDVSDPVTVVPANTGCTIVGTGGADAIDGTAGNDVICGKGGADHLDGLGGSDTLYGAAGADVLTGGTGGDSLVGGKGNDTLLGSDGTGGNDALDGGAGTDTCTADPGDTIQHCP